MFTPDKIEYRMIERASREAEYSTCPSAKVGCVIAKGDLVVSTGYNGAPRGIAHCSTRGCVVIPSSCDTRGNILREYSRHVHAEANAIAAAAMYGRATDKTTAYITKAPCLDCAKLLIQAGIKHIWFSGSHKSAVAFFDQGCVQRFLAEGRVTITYIYFHTSS